MNKYIKILLIPTICLGLSTGKASADDEAVAAIGGFLGGIIATKVFDHHNSHRQSHCSTTVIYSHGHHKHRCDHKCSHYKSHHNRGHYKHGHHKHQCGHSCSHYRPSGYYKTIRVREWVPGCWEVNYNRCGDRIRTWVPGHHTYVTKRVWVSHKETYSNNGYASNHGHHSRHR